MPSARPRLSGVAAAHIKVLALGPLAPSPTPTIARQTSSDQNECDSAEPMVAALHTATPVTITLRGPIRSAIGPEMTEATAKTSRLTKASDPNWNWLRWNLSEILSLIPYTT